VNEHGLEIPGRVFMKEFLLKNWAPILRQLSALPSACNWQNFRIYPTHISAFETTLDPSMPANRSPCLCRADSTCAQIASGDSPRSDPLH